MAAANPPPPSTTAPPSKSDPSHVTVTEKSPPESDHKEVPPSTTAPPPTSDPPQVTVTEQSPTELDHKEAPSPDPAADEVEKEAPPVPAPEPEPDESVKEAPPASTEAAREAEPPREEAAIVESAEKVKSDKKTFIQPAVSFKEESNLVADLSESERKALEELKKLVEEALKNRTMLSPTVEKEASTSAEKKQEGGSMEEVAIWGIPLLKDERSDVILLKFLRARDFKVNDSFMMLKNTLKWRREFGIDKLVEEDLGDDLEKVVFMHGHDREGHPVCYNVYGEFQNKELYAKTFSSEEKRARFLRWRIQFLEKSIRKLDFQPGGVCTIFQINDLKNAPGPGKRELRQATSQALHLLQDNYPEFVAKQVFINVPWWYVAFYTMMSPFMTQRTKSKFVFTRPPKTPTTLFKYISPEQVLIQYGGLSVDFCECDPEFTVADPATDINIKPTTKQFVEIICSEKCVIVWELRVVGWEVTYSAEFIPSAKDGYTVIIHKATKMASNDDPVVSGSFKVSEVGKIVLTVDNPTFKKRKLLYRYKVLPFSD